MRNSGLSTASGSVDDQRALAEIVEQQRRQDQDEPGDADRDARRNAPCRHRAPPSRSPPARPSPAPGTRSSRRAGRSSRRSSGLSAEQHARVLHDVDRRRARPSVMNQSSMTGPNRRADARRCRCFWNDEQHDQDDEGERHDIVVERGRRDLQAFDRAQHRDGGRDHAVAVEQAPRRRCRARR